MSATVPVHYAHLPHPGSEGEPATADATRVTCRVCADTPAVQVDIAGRLLGDVVASIRHDVGWVARLVWWRALMACRRGERRARGWLR